VRPSSGERAAPGRGAPAGRARPPLDRDALIERLADHHRHPRHHGPMPDADVAAGAGNPGCGDVVTVYLKATDRVEAVSFEGTGCTISQGATSILLQRVNQARPTLGALRAMTLEEHLEHVGRQVVGFRERCAAVGFDALRRAVRALETERKLVAAGYSPADARRLRLQVPGTGELRAPSEP
jgi:nitrogen fixation NifU-like protein